MRQDVQPGQDRVVLVDHRLGTCDVSVVCEASSGAAVGYMGAVVLDENRVEVALLPGTDVASVLVQPIEKPQ